MKESDIEVLISTMNRNSLNFIFSMFPFISTSRFKILIINQTSPENLLESNVDKIRVINSFSKGSSKSRNLGLQNAIGKIIVISDDDVVFEDDFANKITEGYSQNCQAGVICFQAKNENGLLLKKYPSIVQKNISTLTILNIGNIEITLNSDKIKESKVQYDELFGVNETFGTGEEAIFLNDLKKKGIQINFIPETIVMHPSLTTSSKLSHIEKYHIYGALYTRMFNNNYIFWTFLNLFFAIKQGKISVINSFDYLKMTLKGRKKYLTLTKNYSL
jgi:GT2 family glycosyltransferase